MFREDLPNGFGRYHDLIKETAAASTLVGDHFEATVTARTGFNLMLFDRQVADVEHRREPVHVVETTSRTSTCRSCARGC